MIFGSIRLGEVTLRAGGKKEAVGKKYAVGDKKDDAPPEAKEKAVEPLHSRKNKMKKAL